MFVEKPELPPSNLVNMGIYLFNLNVLDSALWEDHLEKESAHDFGKNVLPLLVSKGARVFAYPFDKYWVDVGTLQSYWQAHMDLLENPPRLDLYNRDWIIHTRTEERPPARLLQGCEIIDSLICDGCVIEPGAKIIRSILSPGVVIGSGSVINDKRVCVGDGAVIGIMQTPSISIPMIGKNAILPPRIVVQPGATIGVDVVVSDFSNDIIRSGMFIQTRRLANEV
jgi:glucose-1-phosphate adenylyltransferase